jgi:hypothetical protein
MGVLQFFKPKIRYMSSSITNELLMEAVLIKRTALLFKAINHPLRQQMLQFLHENKRMTVTAIFIKWEQETHSPLVGVEGE